MDKTFFPVLALNNKLYFSRNIFLRYSEAKWGNPKKYKSHLVTKELSKEDILKHTYFQILVGSQFILQILWKIIIKKKLLSNQFWDSLLLSF